MKRYFSWFVLLVGIFCFFHTIKLLQNDDRSELLYAYIETRWEQNGIECFPIEVRVNGSSVGYITSREVLIFPAKRLDEIIFETHNCTDEYKLLVVRKQYTDSFEIIHLALIYPDIFDDQNFTYIFNYNKK